MRSEVRPLGSLGDFWKWSGLEWVEKKETSGRGTQLYIVIHG